ncbi:MAG: radical SAM protein [Peptoniphilaceae bacterium]|nr:radical SAM protein [Peptoniphilaceae bacterium]MDD7383649.1 radical SAM protein [Peptoniphilaceae bacterium]MDY3737820.1 radical SAM protein [Peptoniphilaceae bacterium]
MNINYYKNCKLCPHECGIDRFKNLGICKQTSDIKLARASLHMWEEPPITGKNGSGTVFFTGCSLNCVFCQNKKISHTNLGLTKTINELSDIFLRLQNEKKATNINLVTPTHFSVSIAKAIEISKKNGLKIPIVYNTSGFEKEDIIEELKDTVDIFLTDFKYFDDSLAEKYSKIKNYSKYAKSAIKKMYEITGKFKIEENIMKKGVIARILVLPNEKEDAKNIIKFLYDTFKDNIIISIMNQYTPTEKYKYENLNRKVSKEEYEDVVNFAIDLGIENAFIQEDGTVSESFIPNFESFEGIK